MMSIVSMMILNQTMKKRHQSGMRKPLSIMMMMMEKIQRVKRLRRARKTIVRALTSTMRMAMTKLMIWTVMRKMKTKKILKKRRTTKDRTMKRMKKGMRKRNQERLR